MKNLNMIEPELEPMQFQVLEVPERALPTE